MNLMPILYGLFLMLRKPVSSGGFNIRLALTLLGLSNVLTSRETSGS
jgi:hypothetical protein